jgi:hypothetical protein
MLLVDRGHDAARVVVEPVLGPRVPDVLDRVAHDALDVDVRVRADLAADDDQTGGGEGLHRAAHVIGSGGAALVGDVSLSRQFGLTRGDGVQHRIGYLVAHLVRMALGDRLGREQVLPWHGSSFARPGSEARASPQRESPRRPTSDEGHVARKNACALFPHLSGRRDHGSLARSAATWHLRVTFTRVAGTSTGAVPRSSAPPRAGRRLMMSPGDCSTASVLPQRARACPVASRSWLVYHRAGRVRRRRVEGDHRWRRRASSTRSCTKPSS